MLTFAVMPYEHVAVGSEYTFRRVPLNGFDDVDEWTESEINGDRAIVATDGDPVKFAETVKQIEGASIVDRPETIWTNQRTVPIDRGGEVAFDSGEIHLSRPLEELVDYFAIKSEISSIADALATRSEQEGHILLEGLPWELASRVLAETTKLGKTLDDISTGTFPSGATLQDDFNRANGDAGANYTNGPGGTGALSILTNRLTGSPSNYRREYWNVATYGPFSECYFTLNNIVASDSDLGGIELWHRLADIGSGGDGYAAKAVKKAGTDGTKVFRYDNGGQTQLGSDHAQEWTNGEKLGFESNGSTHTPYRFASGSWSALTPQTSSTYTAAGNVAIFLDNNACNVDDFFAGTGVVAVVAGRALLGVGA